MALHRTARGNKKTGLRPSDRSACLIGAALVVSFVAMLISLIAMWQRRIAAVSNMPERHGIAHVESATVNGKYPTQIIYLRFQGELYSVTSRVIHDVVSGKDAEITYRTSQSGDVIIDDVQRIRPIQ